MPLIHLNKAKRNDENMNTIDDCKIIEFKDLGDERGKLVVVEGTKDIPFAIQRVFYIYGSDCSVVRGQHANRKSEFVLINVAGKSKVKIDDGNRQKERKEGCYTLPCT